MSRSATALDPKQHLRLTHKTSYPQEPQRQGLILRRDLADAHHKSDRVRIRLFKD
jgi:hypothetical protein